jgi:AcrR family transcriptional regulator
MSPAPVDRRVRRTRELLHRALLDLIAEKGYDRVTVQDILDRADVGRSTFYAHYRDKEDLLRSGVEDVNAAVAAEIQREGKALTGLLEPLLIVFRHVESHRHMWQPLASKGGLDLGLQMLKQYSEELLREHLRSHFPQGAADRTQLDVAVQFTTGALTGLLTWWVANDVRVRADEVHAMFGRLTIPGLRRFFAAAPPG